MSIPKKESVLTIPLHLHSTRRFKITKSRSRRYFTHYSHYNGNGKQLIGKVYDNEVVMPKLTSSQQYYEASWLDNLSYLPEYLAYLFYSFKGLANVTCVQQIKPLVSDFYLDSMADGINKGFNLCKPVCQPSLFSFDFVYHIPTLDNLWGNAVIYLLHNRLFLIFLLCGSIHMQNIISRFVHSNIKLVDSIHRWYDSYLSVIKSNIIPFSLFVNNYMYIVILTSWIDKYLCLNNYKILYHKLLFSIYNNVRHLLNSVLNLTCL